MNMEKRFFLLLAAIGFGVLTILPLQAKEASSSSCDSFGVQRFEGKKEAPLFSLKDLNGKQVSLSDYKGKPLLLFFWGSFCEACKEDIVLLEKIFEGKKDQLEILTLAIDGEKEKRVKSIVKKKKVTLPVLLDIKEKTARAYGVKMIPTAFLINREGGMEGKIVGPRDWSSSEASSAIKELLNLR
jgi:peroxiredoxin